MGSKMAAAIAQQKNRDTSVFLDAGPVPDSVVVYRERTAL
jgi:hypothetical protein